MRAAGEEDRLAAGYSRHRLRKDSPGLYLAFLEARACCSLVRRLDSVARKREMHTSSWFLPRELFTRQPELYRMNDTGERSPDAYFCFMNDAAWDITADRGVQLQRLLPAETERYFSPMT